MINRGLQRTVRTYIDNTNTKVDKPEITEDCKNLYRQYKYSLNHGLQRTVRTYIDNTNILSTTLIVINRGLQRTVRTYIDKTNTKVDKPWITEDCKNLYRQYKHYKVDKPWITEDGKNLYRQYKH